MLTSLSPPGTAREDEPRILAVRDLSWPVSIAIPLPPDLTATVSCVVPKRTLRCPMCGQRREVA